MILVVADTSPLRYLVETAYEFLLPRLFTKVWIPGTVIAEFAPCTIAGRRSRVGRAAPSWVEVRQVEGLHAAHELAGLDRGEWEAIELAKRIQANLLLIDERAGVRVARAQGFTVTGTLGILVEAARSGLISIDEALARLAQTSFRRTPDLFAQNARTCAQGRSRLSRRAALPNASILVMSSMDRGQKNGGEIAILPTMNRYKLRQAIARNAAAEVR